jgi:Domain of unknown function (DUF4249)
MRRIIPILFLFVMACVDPLDVKLPAEERRLVVDGLITNRPGPYQVKLYYSNPLSTTKLRPFDPVTLAQVFIVDDQNNKYNLAEVRQGVYETNGVELTGQIGRGYYLTIKTKAGKEYQSDIERIKPSGEINNLYFEFQDNNNPDSTYALKVFIDLKGELEEDNLFRWRWTTIHKTKSNPERETRTTPSGEIPVPQLCSGYRYERRELIQFGDCTCCICWSYNYSPVAMVSKNAFVNEIEFNKQYLGLIPVTSMHFYDRYYIEVEQLSLSEEAYHYWSLIEKQQAGSMDLFQPNAIKIRGNIKNINNAEEEVLGFFGASGAAVKSLYIQQSEVPFELPPLAAVNYPCTQYFKNATTEKPFFW